MRLTSMSISNFRSIKAVDNLRIEPLQAFVGENNAGKSNILRALACFLSSGAGGMEISDFNDAHQPATILAEFSGLSDSERNRLRPYLVADKIILKKVFTLEVDEKSGKQKVETAYHGYRAEPREWFLSVIKIEARNQGARTNWRAIAEENRILDYVRTADGAVTKASYQNGLREYLARRPETEYDAAELGQTQALGIPQNLLAALPVFYLLPAITDYSDEVSQRSTTSVFRRLMADLSDRVMRADQRYVEIEDALSALHSLLNRPRPGVETRRLTALGDIETTLCDTVKKLMPGVRSVELTIDVDESKEIFSKGVTVKINDGVLTDVIDKGHGLQRSIVFAFLQLLVAAKHRGAETRPIILAIEEPELYIHPHTQRLIYRVLKDFAGLPGETDVAQGTDQVLYSTHSPVFVDVSRYERICVVRKEGGDGTKAKQCEPGALETADERKTFKLLTCFGLKHNELFFARDCILVEGEQDEIGIVATARKLGRFVDLPDEIGLAVVVAGDKGSIPKFQKILNAFGIAYGVLLELDGRPEAHNQNAPVIQNLNGNRCYRAPNTIEAILGLEGHFDDVCHAKTFFSNPANISAEMERLVAALLPPVA
jgi:putative ATP-dependent endonuclease of the OLD family